MLIRKLSLSGYNRLATTSIKTIEIQPKNKIVLIIGLNGCGKSSLLKELTPLPAISQEYQKDGYKFIEIEHNGKIFSLLSDFGSAHKHSFRVDGEELNQPGTLQIQRELVKEYFNITQEIHDLMLGNKSFHKMSPKERNDWFNKLCSTDYSFALNVYNKLKEKLRDTQGALNHVKSRRVEELNKKETEEKKNSLLLYKNQLDTQLEHLLSFNNSNDNKLDVKYQAYHSLMHKIRDNSNLLNNKLKQLSFSSVTLLKRGDLNQRLLEVEKLISNNEGMLIALTNELDSLLEIKNLSKDEGSSFDIAERIKELESSLSNTKAMSLKFSDSHSAYVTLCSIKDLMFDLLTQLLEFDQSLYSEAKHQKAVADYKALDMEKLKVHSELTTLDSLITNYESSKTECPECHHTWYRSVEQNRLNEIKANFQTLSTRYNDIKAEMKRLEEYTETSNSYLARYKNVVNIIYSSPILKPVWDIASKEKLVSLNPLRLKSLLEEVELDLKEQLDKSKIESELKYLKDTLSLINKIGLQGSSSVNERLEDIQNKISHIYDVNNKLNNELTRLRETEVWYETIDEQSKQLSNYIETSKTLLSDIVQSLEACKVSKYITFVRKELDITNSKLNELTHNEQILNYLEQEEKEQNLNLELCKILIDSMSPKSGLLALGMSGFINDTLRRMNEVISNIWTYPLELLPCNIDDGENLDYRFPMKVGDGNVISDINVGSSAMKEIVDLSFRLIAMKYLGLNNYPIYIDELGASFDEKHREAAFYLIKEMSGSADFSQVFLISHYNDCYGCLTNIDTIILSPENITVTDSLKNSSCCLIKRD